VRWREHVEPRARGGSGGEEGEEGDEEREAGQPADRLEL
jgi:hypothetical protein